jgi:hypothetical protein
MVFLMADVPRPWVPDVSRLNTIATACEPFAPARSDRPMLAGRAHRPSSVCRRLIHFAMVKQSPRMSLRLFVGQGNTRLAPVLATR